MRETSIWSLVGWTMLHYVWAGSAFAIVAWIARRALRSAHPDVIYAYSLACLGVLTLMPVAIAGWVDVPTLPTPPIAPRFDLEAAGSVTIPSEPLARSIDVPSFRPRPQPEPEPFGLTSLVGRLPWLWLLGTPITLGWLVLGLAGAERLRITSRRLADDTMNTRLLRMSEAIGLSRTVAVAVSDRIVGPVLVGIVRPMILLPPCALTGWTVEALEMAMLHELAHVRRWDNLVNLLQRLGEALLFFHPAVWIVSGWARTDREHCCDHLVVTQTGRPLAYAQALLDFSDRQTVPRSLGVAMAEGSLLVRIRRILKVKEEPMKPTRLALAFSAAPLLVPALLLAAQIAPGLKPKADPRPSEKAQDSAKTAAARKVVAEALELLRRPGTQPIPVYGSIAIAKAQIKLGDRDGAQETIREAIQVARAAKRSFPRPGQAATQGASNARDLSQIAWFQAESGDKPGALATLRSIVETIPGQGDEGAEGWYWLNTLHALARQLTELGALDEARQVVKKTDAYFETIPPSPFDPPKFSSPVASAHLAIGDVDGAFALLDRFEQSLPNGGVKDQGRIGQFLANMARSVPIRDRAVARTTIDRIAKRLETIELDEDKTSALIVVAETLARLGDFDAAMKVARRIGEGPTRLALDLRGNKPFAMRFIAEARQKAGDAAGARQTLREARDLAKATDARTGTSNTLAGVAQVMLKIDDLPGAQLCVDDMPVGRRAETLKQIGLAQRARGDAAAARATLAKALTDASYHIDHPLKPGVDTRPSHRLPIVETAEQRATALRELAAIQALSGDFAAARKTAETILDPTRRATALADIAKAQAGSGDVEGALTWVRDLKELATMNPSPLEAVIEGAAGIRD